MVQNRVCQLVKVKYPILQGALGIYPSGELAAAVSNAGGLGTIPGMQGGKVAQREIRKARSLTTKPIAINLPLVFFQRRRDGKKQAEKLADMAIEEGISAIVISAGDPTELTRRYAPRGIAVIVVCASVAHALRAQSAGADIIVASGMEAGGVTSREQTGSLALIPQVVDAVDTPVIAAGGIADSRGFVAAIALGAEGIQMGTRFIATSECPAPNEHKQLIL